MREITKDEVFYGDLVFPVVDIDGNKYTEVEFRKGFGTRVFWGIIRKDEKSYQFGFFPFNAETYANVLYIGYNNQFFIDVYDINLIDEKERIFSFTEGFYIVFPEKVDRGPYMDRVTLGEYSHGKFPYKTIIRQYSANALLEQFKSCYKNFPGKISSIRKQMKYTFGLEFETSSGYVPEWMCYKNGLIPLRDGSISGIEYSTVILNNHNGFDILREQIRILGEHTLFNKDCSLHIHFGGYPVTPISVFVLNEVCAFIQEDLMRYVPEWTFDTSKIKSSHKNYCDKIKSFLTFPIMYKTMSEGDKNFLGSLTEAHPRDNSRSAKWNIHSRYVWANLINMLFYNNCKTVEFRFLRPTYNYNKIINWIYVLNAILVFSEKITNEIQRSKLSEKGLSLTSEDIRAHISENHGITDVYDSLSKIFYIVYGESSIYNGLIEFLDNLNFIVSSQQKTDDYYGEVSHFDKIIYSNVLNE